MTRGKWVRLDLRFVNGAAVGTCVCAIAHEHRLQPLVAEARLNICNVPDGIDDMAHCACQNNLLERRDGTTAARKSHNDAAELGYLPSGRADC